MEIPESFSFKKFLGFAPPFTNPVRLGNRTYRAWGSKIEWRFICILKQNRKFAMICFQQKGNLSFSVPRIS